MADTEAPSRRALREVVDDVIARRMRGESWTDEEVVLSHSDLMPQLEEELRKINRVEQARLATIVDRSRAGSSPAQDLTAGDFNQPQVDGYDVLRLINHGGQAMIYLARDRATGKEVALKVLRFGALADGKQRARFER